MTLQDLDTQGLLRLPAKSSWEKQWRGEQTYYTGNLSGLTLKYVNVWGKIWTDNDDTFLLSCTDSKGNYYTTEITEIDETVSRYFLSVFGVENYSKSMEEILTLELAVENPSITLFKKYPILH